MFSIAKISFIFVHILPLSHTKLTHPFYPCSFSYLRSYLTQRALLWLHQCVQLSYQFTVFQNKLGHLTETIILLVSGYFEALNLFITGTFWKLALYKYLLRNLSLYFCKVHTLKFIGRHIFLTCLKLKTKELQG